MEKQKRSLGRGLSALMADINVPEAEPTSDAPTRPDMLVPIEQVAPNPDQPRRQFTEEALSELAASIRAKGILQPLIVRYDPSGSATYQIVAGERRWRAAQRAQLHEVPVLVRELSDTEVLEFAIIENIQRADLNPVEEARGYRQLMDRFGHTQEKLAEALGKSRSHIANLLRLLGLPEEIQRYLVDGQLSAGHARALITTENPEVLARQVIEKGLSVRDTERLAKPRSEGGQRGRAQTSKPVEKDADTRALEQDLAATLGMSVNIDHKPGKPSGKLTISYDDLEQLDNLCRILSLRPVDATI